MSAECSPMPIVRNGVYRSSSATTEELEALPKSAEITEVNLRGSVQLTSIEPLRGLRSLQRVDLTKTSVADISPLAGHPALTHLSFMAPKERWDHESLRLLPALTHLWLGGDPAAADLAFLRGLGKLRFVDLGYCPVGDLSVLAELPALEELELGFAQLSDLEGLRGCRNLRVLGLAGLTQLRDLGPLAGMERLEVLMLDGCTGLTDLSPLAGLLALENLMLLNCTGVTDLSPLVGLPNLKGVSTSGSGVEQLPEGLSEDLLID
ncbi:hypothetical protein GC173_12135 [bacterium]|nr:hypothetical protein [bacterium]